MSDRPRREKAFRSIEDRVVEHFLPGAVEKVLAWQDSPIRTIEVGAGPPIVFLHGVTGTWSNFASLAASFVERARCILVDLPGHGLSGPLELRGRRPRDVLVDAAATVIEQRTDGRQAVVVGNSLGGMTALWLAADRPDLVAGLAILGEPAYAFAGAKAEPPLDILLRPKLGRLALSFPPPPMPIYRRLIRKGFGRGALAGIDRDVLDLNRRAVAVGHHARSVAGLMSTIGERSGFASPGTPIEPEELRRITPPTWFLWGTDDPFMSPDDGRPFVDEIPHATIDVVVGGHVPWFDAPDLSVERIGALLPNA